MTKADDHHAAIDWAFKTGQGEEVVREFYRRIRTWDWSIKGIRKDDYGDVSIEISRYNPETKERMEFSLRRPEERDIWHIDHQMISDAELMEILGVPGAYLDGMKDILEAAGRSSYNELISEKYEKVKAKYDELDEQQRFHEELTKQFIINSQKKLESGIDRLAEIINERMNHDWKPIPEERYRPPERPKESDLPENSGIYLVWSLDEAIEYVGQSVNLRNRVTMNHNCIEPGDLVSLIEYPVQMLDFAESYYIGICQPKRNFGESAKWRANTKETPK